MVIINDSKFTEDISYREHFQSFPYELSDFQKHSIKAIVDGNHSLVCCGTGNGKTNSGEFAIKHFVGQGKRVIYTVPIRSLGNQKFYDFTNKFPDITFGLLTGEIKSFPNAQVLIMTQEILMNFLFLSNNDKNNDLRQLQFQIDINNELAAVIVDECHFIMDENRGHAWESALLMLPKKVQLVMLSATLDNPTKLALWVEKRHEDDSKKVVISSTKKRIIPLVHYTYLTTTESIFKKVKDKSIQQEIRNSTNKLLMIKDENGLFDDSTFIKVKKIKQIFENNQVYLNKQNVLNNLAKHLNDNEMLPAIFFCFSRKNVENFAQEMTTNLLEFDSKIPYTIRREAEQIVRKLPNFAEYTSLPEYEILMKLLEKGIGCHHSGMVTVLREIVELFISKGYIKILFCTDSFSVGLNCPIKTTVFTGLRKFDGKTEQYIEPHLYAQCSGRAGRRGIDNIGYVIHCNNLFDLPCIAYYKEILCGKPQTLLSKFRISYGIILNMIKNENITFESFVKFVNKSMISDELKIRRNSMERELIHEKIICEKQNSFVNHLRTPNDVLNNFVELKNEVSQLQNKKKKECERKISSLMSEYKFIDEDSMHYKKNVLAQGILLSKQKDIELCQNFIEINVQNICQILVSENFISYDPDEELFSFTQKGRVASQFAEMHPLVLADSLDEIEMLSVHQLICLFSCFTDIRVHQDHIITTPNFIQDKSIKKILQRMTNYFEKCESFEELYNLQTGIDYSSVIVYDLVDEMNIWCDAQDQTDCKRFIQDILSNKNISIGDFSKVILKISAITKEIINICESEGKVEFLNKLCQIDNYILKFICTNQSLYI